MGYIIIYYKSMDSFLIKIVNKKTEIDEIETS